MVKRKLVFVGLSGGVDSAVSAALLKKADYEVVGVFMHTWHPKFLECNEEEEKIDSMRVAASLDIPFLTFDFEKVYKKEVADYMIREYKVGRTPNPDVMCNKHVKFGVFFKKAISMGADYVATGHYAQNKKQDFHFLEKGIDATKDQSYFLWTLRREQLNKILFPVGHLNKIEVRKLAKKFNLSVAAKKDSQGICFLGAVDLKEFLKHYIKQKKGIVISEKGEKIGYHNGAIFYTLGERHGFTITKKNPDDGAYYIISKDIKKNILIATKDKNFFHKSTNIFLLKNFLCSHRSRLQVSFEGGFCLCLNNTNWISGIPRSDKNYTAQIRYHGEFLSCKIKITGKTRAEITFQKSVLVAPGQSCVLYHKDICLGGGIVI